MIAVQWLLAAALLHLASPVAHKAVTKEEILETLKARYNYASSDCAARVLSTNRGCKSASSILQSQKDTYLLNLCSYPSKHIIIELCQDIRIDTLILANFEYFSSTVREFRVSVSKRYPAVGWREVGQFVAENGRGEQVFRVEGAEMYTRYLRIDFDTHYGNEYYCLVSVLRVLGKTMMEVFEESASALPEKKQPRESVPISTIKATVLSTASIEPRSVQKTTEHVEEPVADQLPAELQTAVYDFMKLFQPQSCRATPPTTTKTVDSEDGEFPPVRLPQENVFKAIYDRLQQLERNVTRSSKNLQEEIKMLTGDMKYVQEEIGIIETNPKNPLFSNASRKRSFRARLLHHIEKRTVEYTRGITEQVDQMLEEVRLNDRLVFWIAIYSLLQITALISVVAVGFALGWFRSQPVPKPIRPMSPSLHRRWRSDGAIDGEAEQLVPTSASASDMTRDASRSQSPADLIATASRPLLLDEEAELIDACYTSLSSPASMELDNKHE
ncbi:hypothetical protein PSACC_01798 [Paramicrosporidium saccamoebae]|uniref:SUN domain-containing protein n=1 Tax=Paramicrosporidium saccamoebae TaxID=1246581 RepID=A0A2H9TL55_9FUNG|nr:hypothetical protein PSACC_01798 [Paramicrosporidium saccamoebae]